MIIILPFFYQNTGFRHKGLFLDSNKLGDYLHISPDLVFRLTARFNDEKFRKSDSEKVRKSKINRLELALNYKKLIEDGLYKNKAELAKSLNVSRAWITKVFNEIKS